MLDKTNEKENLNNELTSILKAINPDLIKRFQGCQVVKAEELEKS